MKEEILTAEQWVDEYNEDNDSQYSAYDCNYLMMERYSNYKNRILEGKILQFRQTVKNTIQPIQVEEYDEYFGIQIAREGKIG